MNFSRHGLRLADGIAMIDADRLARSQPDPHPDGDRWQTVGRVGGLVVLFVVHTEPGESTPGRIISVRRATAHERRAYEEEAE